MPVSFLRQATALQILDFLGSILGQPSIYSTIAYEREGDPMEKNLARYEDAARLLPEGLRRLALACSAGEKAAAEEFRLRTGCPLSVLYPEGERFLRGSPPQTVTPADLQAVLDRATSFSVYRCADSIRCGYVTVQGGCRVGLCGTAVLRQGQVATLQELSSVSVRIAKELPGIASGLYPRLFQAGRFAGALFIAPPGGGKTTLLRDLIRYVSDGIEEHAPMRVAVVDERGELAAVCGGTPQFQMGAHTDVLTGVAKAEGIEMVLRAMNPEVIAVDEITAPDDIRAMVLAANCGVSFLATVHGVDLDEIRQRRICRALLETELFHRFVILEGRGSGRRWRVEKC